MTWIVYTGPSPAVDIAATRQRATRGVPVDVEASVASALLDQASWDPGATGAGGSVVVATAGQTLVLSAVTLDGGAVTLYTDAEATTPATLPLTIATDTTLYLSAGTTGTLSLSTSWAGGVALDPVGGTVRDGKTLTLAPYPTIAQIVSGVSTGGGSTTDGGTP